MFLGKSVCKKSSGDKLIKEERSKKRKRKKIGKIFLVILIILAILFLLVWKVFTVKTVEVTGNELYTDEQIKGSVLNDKYSWNTLYVYFKYKLKETKDIPFVDTMEISMEIPHTIHIKVYEKGLIGYVKLESDSSKYVYFDKDGIVCEISNKLIEGLPQIKGVSVSKAKLSQSLPIEKSTLKSLLSLNQTLSKYGLAPGVIRCKDNGEFILKFGKVKINFGTTSDLEEKVIRLKEIYPKLKKYKGTLHMENYSDQTRDLVFEKNKKG